MQIEIFHEEAYVVKLAQRVKEIRQKCNTKMKTLK